MNNDEAVEDMRLEGHTDLVTGLAISPDGNHLLSNRYCNRIPQQSPSPLFSISISSQLLDLIYINYITLSSLSHSHSPLPFCSMDSDLHQWDVKPFRAGGTGASRWERSYEGAKHGAEKLLLKCSWSPDQEKVACGSADRYTEERRGEERRGGERRGELVHLEHLLI
jgi:WD40 repeat protein